MREPALICFWLFIANCVGTVDDHLFDPFVHLRTASLLLRSRFSDYVSLARRCGIALRFAESEGFFKLFVGCFICRRSIILRPRRFKTEDFFVN